MKHLVRRPQVGSFLRILPCRFSIFRFPKTISWLNSQKTLLELLKRNMLKDWQERQTEVSESFKSLKSFKDIESQGVPKFLDWPKLQTELSELESINLEDRNTEEDRAKLVSKLRINSNLCGKNMEPQGVPNFSDWLSELRIINLEDKNTEEDRAKLVSKLSYIKDNYLRPNETMDFEELKKRVALRNIYFADMKGQNMESKGVPIYKVLAAYILPPKLKRIEIFLDKLEEKGPQGTALATLRRSERLLFSDEYRYLLRPKEYKALMTMYMDRGEKEDLRRLWNLAKNDMKLLDGKGYSLTILAFVTKEDIEGAQEVLEGWDNGIFHVEVRDVLDFRYQRKRVMEEAELVVEDMLEDHNEEEEKKNRAMEVRQNGWNPKKNLALAAYASAQYVEGRRDIESAVDVLRLLGTQDPQDGNNDRLSRKMVEAMIGGGYFGEQE